MARDWEATFDSWGKAPSQTERDRCDNAERAIKKAIDASEAMARRGIRVFAQGSHANRTNVREDSDVDICVCCSDTFYFDLPAGETRESCAISPATYPYAQFKADVGSALAAYFGQASVSRGAKAFDVHANTYRVDADVVPTFEYRLYTSRTLWHGGTTILPDGGGMIVNWPDQNYANGVAKNQVTGRRFKAVVRILKRLRNEMKVGNIPSAAPIPSFLIESLVSNVPNEGFEHPTLTEDLGYAIAHLWRLTRQDEQCAGWFEVNGLKPLFGPLQKWSRVEVNSFLQAAWHYVGYQ